MIEVNPVELLDKMENIDYVNTVYPAFDHEEWEYLMELVRKDITEVD